MKKFAKKEFARPLSQTSGGGRVLVGIKKVNGLWIGVIVDTDRMKGVTVDWADRITKFTCFYPYQKTKKESQIIDAAKRYAAKHKAEVAKVSKELLGAKGGKV